MPSKRHCSIDPKENAHMYPCPLGRFFYHWHSQKLYVAVALTLGSHTEPLGVFIQHWNSKTQEQLHPSLGPTQSRNAGWWQRGACKKNGKSVAKVGHQEIFVVSAATISNLSHPSIISVNLGQWPLMAFFYFLPKAKNIGILISCFCTEWPLKTLCNSKASNGILLDSIEYCIIQPKQMDFSQIRWCH